MRTRVTVAFTIMCAVIVAALGWATLPDDRNLAVLFGLIFGAIIGHTIAESAKD